MFLELLVMNALVVASGSVSLPPPTPVKWEAVRSAISETICVVPEPQAPEGYWVSVGDRAACGLSAAAAPLERALSAAFEQARPLLASVPHGYTAEPKGIESAYKGKDDAERNHLARDAYLSHEDFLRALVPRLQSAMTAEGLACEGCPHFEPKATRTVKWEVFSEYVNTFVRPDPVRTPIGADGKPSGMPRLSFHICTGLSDVLPLPMKDADPVLLRAGFVLTMASQSIRQRTADHFGEMVNEDDFRKLQSDEERTSFLREHLAARLKTDPEVREGICGTLEKFKHDLGVAIIECSAGKT